MRICKTELAEKLKIDNRPTTKIKVSECDLEKLPKTIRSASFNFMTKTEGFVWIDDPDKAITKMEIYARKEFPNLSKSDKPLVVIEAAKIPAGFWFWKNIKVEALENKSVFPEYKSNWQYEFYNYRLSNVEVQKVETN